MFLIQTYSIVDADWYNDCTTNSLETYFTFPSSVSRSYSNDGVTLSNSGSYASMPFYQSFSTPKVVEFELIDHNQSAPNMVLGQIGSTWIYCEYNYRKTQFDFSGTTVQCSSTLGKWRFEIDTNQIKVYRENTLLYTYNGSLSTLAFQIQLSGNRSATIKDLLIKPL